MQDQHVKKDMQKHVIDYHNYVWARNRGKDVKVLFQDAPYCLQADVYLEITRDMLENVCTRIQRSCFSAIISQNITII